MMRPNRSPVRRRPPTRQRSSTSPTRQLPPTAAPPFLKAFWQWLLSLPWRVIGAYHRLPEFARINPYHTSYHRGVLEPLCESRWSTVVQTWKDPVTVVRRVQTTDVEGGLMQLARAYVDPNVYIQCGLKDIVPPENSPIWNALHATDQLLVERVAARGGRLFGKFERVASFITPKGATDKITYTHYDEYNGFLCLVRGMKHVFVADPNACTNTGKLKPNETTQTPFDTDGFIHYQLNAGDVLYIPKGFWHYVITPADTVLVTFWFY